MFSAKFNFTKLLRLIAIAFICCYVFTIFPGRSLAVGINEQMNFQGKVVNSNGTNVTDGYYSFVFKLYNSSATGASAQYTEDWTTSGLWTGTVSSRTDADTIVYATDTNESTLAEGQYLTNTTRSETVIIRSVNTSTNTLEVSDMRTTWAGSDAISNKIYVKDGVFRVSLGTLTSIASFDFNNESIFLGVNFNADGEMRPLIKYTAVPYAFNAEKVNGLTVTNNGGNTLDIAANKTLTVSNSLTFTGGDGESVNFGFSGNVVTEDGEQTLTGKGIGDILFFLNSGVDISTLSNQNLVITPDGTGKIGLFTLSPLATLDIRANSGTLAVASVSGTSSFAALITDNNGVGDLFTASKSGATKFTINNAGNLVIGNMITDANAVLYTTTGGVVTRVAETETGSQCLLSGAGSSGVPTWGACGAASSTWTSDIDADGFSLLDLGTNITARGALTIASTGSNALTLDSGNNVLTLASSDTTLTATGLTTITSDATLAISAATLNLGGGSAATIGTASDDNLSLTPNGSGNLILTGDFDTQVLIGASGATTEFPLLVRSGIGSNAVLAVDQLNTGDLFTASASGTTQFTIDATGAISGETNETINGIDISSGAVSDVTTFSLSGAISDSDSALIIDDDFTITTGTTITANSITAFSATSLATLTSAATLAVSATTLNLGGGSAATIGTVSDDNLNLTPNGSGDIVVSGDGDTNLQVTFSAAPGVDMIALTNSGQGVTATGIDGLAIAYETGGSTGSNDNAGLRIDVTSNNSGTTTTLEGIYIGNLSSAEANSTESGLRIGTGWDQGILIESGGSTNSGLVYTNGGRPTKKITLNAEYPGAALTASGSGTITGSMTSDASPSAELSNWRTYYEWSSTQTSLHDYTVAVRVKLPEDFSAWATADALTVSYNTELTTSNTSKVDALVYNADTSLSAADQATPVVYSQANVSATAKVWLNLSIDDSLLDSGAARDLDAAGDTAVIYLKMYSKDSNHVQVGDIVLSYLAKF